MLFFEVRKGLVKAKPAIKTVVKLSSIISKLLAKIPAGHVFFSGDYADGEADYVYIRSGLPARTHQHHPDE